MSRPNLLLPIAMAGTLLGAGGAMSASLQSPGSARLLPGDQGTITTPAIGSSRLNGHARAYRLCFWTAHHPHAGIPTSGNCIAPAGGDPGTRCSCRTEYGVFGGTVE